MWVACAVMAGLSQGGGVGLSLANWMVDGDPDDDIWAMDVARYGDWATLAYTNAKVRENYSRRFRITFPNEELPAARPLHTTPIYDRLTAHNAVWGAGFGLEHPLWFQEPGKEPIERRHVPPFQRVRLVPRNRAPCANASDSSRGVELRQVQGQWRRRRRMAAGPVHQPAAEDRPHAADGDAQPAGPDRRRVLRVADRSTTSSSCSVRRRPRCTIRVGSSTTCRPTSPDPFRGARAVDGRPHRRRAARARRAAEAHQQSLANADFPFMSFRRVDIGMAPCGCRG